ncbi:hypothetical protein [Alistipes sp.]|uniref:hypothetical protein n=1 Tax=Alistipes sp. TaxID=1872444 RepID=UPI003AB39D04
MNRIEIPDIGLSADIPASYSEMTRPQVYYVMQQLHALSLAKISLAEFRVRVLYYLAGVKRTARSIAWERLHPAEARRRAEKVVILAEELLGFLFTTDRDGMKPVFDTIINHLPVLHVGATHLIGPGDGMIDISFGELIAADADLALCSTTKDERHIDNMIARLYRRPGPMQPCGRRVRPFKMEETERYARLIRRLPGWQKQLIMYWYAACIDNLQHGYFFVSGREVTFEPLFSHEESVGESLGWLTVQFDLAEKNIFGGIDGVAEANIIDVLTLLLNYKQTADHVRKLKTDH